MLERVQEPRLLSRQRVSVMASWLLVLPLLTEGVALNVVKIEVAGLGVLAFTTVVLGRQPLPHRAVERIFLTFAVLTLIVLTYLAFGTWPAYAGSARSYDTHAALFVATYGAVAIFTVLFFEERLFEKVLWRGATLALGIGLASCAVSRLTGHLLLVNANDGGLRMVGTLTEPSDWAPILTLVLLHALRRRSWLYTALAFAGLALADSPTCMLVMAITVPLYYALTASRHYRVPLMIAMAVIVASGVLFVVQANPGPWLASGNAEKIAVGRLVEGIQAIGSNGQPGANGRWSNAEAVLADARSNGWMLFGAGPVADATYFPATYPQRLSIGGALGGGVAPNAIWISTLFDLGEVGVAVLGALMVTAVWRMRRFPQTAAILLPFFTASLVNSTVPDYGSVVALGIMLFTFGWIRTPSADDKSAVCGPGNGYEPEIAGPRGPVPVALSPARIADRREVPRNFAATSATRRAPLASRQLSDVSDVSSACQLR